MCGCSNDVRKMCQIYQGLELRVVPMWVLGFELWSSGNAASTLSHGATSQLNYASSFYLYYGESSKLGILASLETQNSQVRWIRKFLLLV